MNLKTNMPTPQEGGWKERYKKFAILPLSEEIHAKANNTEMKEILDLIMLSRATDAEIIQISKAVNYFQRKRYLEKKYGVYRSTEVGSGRK